MTEKHLKNYYQIFIDCWALFKKYSNPVEGKGYWDAMTGEANEIYIKHGRAPFSEKMLGLVMDELEGIYKGEHA